MLTNKRYYIPKYLYKRKIELIRQKIIKRKYGYLFYRKCVCKILPSEANNHYKLSLKQKYIKKWILIWYEARIEWKLLLRAKIHYNLRLQHNILSRWKYFLIQQKSRKIKEKIAIAYYQINYKRQLIQACFNKWKFYLRLKLYKKHKFTLSSNFFRSKYKTEFLIPYMKRWIVFGKVCKKNKAKLLKAKMTYEYNLIFKVIFKLLHYTNRRKTKRERMKHVKILYEKKLKIRTIHSWLLFVKDKKKKSQDMILAKAHYCHKIKISSFAKLLKNRNRNQYISHKLSIFEEWKSKQFKIMFFTKLKVYFKNRLLKQQKLRESLFYFELKLKKKTFCCLRKYREYRQQKKIMQQRLLDTIIFKLNFYKTKRHFEKWKIFREYKVRQRHKVQIANSFYNKCILQTVVHIWMGLVIYKKNRRFDKMKAFRCYNSKLLKMAFSMWKDYVNGEKEYKKKLQCAKEYYERNIATEALLVIIKAGLKKKEENMKNTTEKMQYQLHLAQKYLSKWKQKTIYTVGKANVNLQNEMSVMEDKENIPTTSNFDWYQICFLTPRLPKNYLNNNCSNF